VNPRTRTRLSRIAAVAARLAPPGPRPDVPVAINPTAASDLARVWDTTHVSRVIRDGAFSGSVLVTGFTGEPLLLLGRPGGGLLAAMLAPPGVDATLRTASAPRGIATPAHPAPRKGPRPPAPASRPGHRAPAPATTADRHRRTPHHPGDAHAQHPVPHRP
jgi:hypothetical protein